MEEQVESIRDIPTPILKAMRNMCPKRNGGSLEISIPGEPEEDAVKLTYETRRRIDAELKRRKEAR